MDAVSNQQRALPSNHSFLKMIKVLGQTSSTTVLAVLFSVFTNKLLSVFGGVDAIGTMGIYRNFGSLVSGLLGFGYATVIMQKVSVAKDSDDLAKVIRAALVLFLFQFVSGVIGILVFSYPVALWLIGPTPSLERVRDIGVVIMMGLFNIWLQTLIAVFRGLSKLWVLSAIQLSQAIASLILISLLLKMGTLGLAIHVGSGGLVATLIGIYFLSKEVSYSQVIKDFKEGAEILLKTANSSFLMVLVSLIVTGGMLGIQSIVQRSYGLTVLGNFNAAYLIVETSVLIMSSSAYSYFLPGFGKCRDDDQKKEFISRMLRLMLAIAASGALVLMFASRWIIPLLFSHEFDVASGFLRVCGIGLIGVVLNWVYNTLFLHKANYKDYVLVELISMLGFLGSVGLGAYLKQPPLFVAWSYAGTCTFKGCLYALVARFRYGSGYIRLTNIGICLGLLVLLTVAEILS